MVEGDSCLNQSSSLQSHQLVVEGGGTGGGRRVGRGLGHHNSPVAQLQQLRQMEDLDGKNYRTLVTTTNMCGKYLFFKHFLRLLVVVTVLVTSHLTGQKPTMETVGVRVASWEGLKRK